MRDDFLGHEWADSHQIWADTVAIALQRIARLPAILFEATKRRRVAIGLACVREDSSIRKA
ncbi:hypothetical protein [Sphingomonas sp. DBB INV C78]|uniref:hypothetical protein n=1 Tax=Sphingomonas sp. DBB INV C78 TaxID=3349434 RepID=UPI0036D367FE